MLPLEVRSQTKIVELARFYMDDVDEVPGLEWTGNAVEIHSDRPVAVEQTHYFCVPR